jgi:phenylpyruvate tautomerase PptA (4-oxalocrotonate tautomerase family)
MNQPTAYHQIGRFIVSFQHAEAALTELLVLMAHADDEAIRILVNELEYGGVGQVVEKCDVILGHVHSSSIAQIGLLAASPRETDARSGSVSDDRRAVRGTHRSSERLSACLQAAAAVATARLGMSCHPTKRRNRI